MLALHGFEAYGLEISETGAATARKYGENELKNPRLYNFYSDKIPEQINPGTVKVLQGDFFLNEWERGIAGEDLKFDLVYDYTVRANQTFSAGHLTSAHRLTFKVSLRSST